MEVLRKVKIIDRRDFNTDQISREKIMEVLRQVKWLTKNDWGPKTGQIGRQKD